MAQLGLVVPDELAGFSIDEMVTIAQRAEQRGYHSIWKGETSGTNSFMVLGAIARETEDIRLGTGIANVFSRSPTLLGMSGATLNALSDGRAILGLGVSSPPIVEEWHGQAYERPLRRAREAIEIIRQVLDGDTVEYDGEMFDVGPYSVGFETPSGEVPIFNAAMGERNRQLTGEFADGWMPVFTPLSELGGFATEITSAAADAGRPEPTIAPWVPAAVAEDPSVAKRRVKELLAQEMAMGYNRILATHGYGDSADEAHNRWHDGDREGATDAITDEVVEEFAVYGTPETCREQLAPYYEAGADLPILWPPFTASRGAVEELIDGFAPE
ncbi:MAG: putative F420-dependent oxidoreductase [Natronomonas sp.]|jgi:probable F420-dependent oxidoreductase|uniref:LLM class flavin-dependent oxidoreductase n=1 Tax=Natronomonas sp. TaxID=2184060 RepID=UPI00398A15AF